jgi:hypothetical protein
MWAFPAALPLHWGPVDAATLRHNSDSDIRRSKRSKRTSDSETVSRSTSTLSAREAVGFKLQMLSELFPHLDMVELSQKSSGATRGVPNGRVVVAGDRRLEPSHQRRTRSPRQHDIYRSVNVPCAACSR